MVRKSERKIDSERRVNIARWVDRNRDNEREGRDRKKNYGEKGRGA